MGKSMYWFE